MAKIGWGHVLAAGLNGYVGGRRMVEDKEQREQDRAMRKEEFDARREELNRQKQERISLANAARPTSVEEGAGGMIRPETMDNRDVGLPENDQLPNQGLTLGGYRAAGKTFTDRAAADTAAQEYNAPDATMGRVAAAQTASDPVKGIGLQNAITLQKRAAETFTAEQQKRARQIQEEGYLDGVKASRTGDPQAVFDAFNKSGKIKLAEVPTVTPSEREVPGIGKITTYDYSGTLIGPDGQPRPFKANSHDLSMQALPFEKAIEFQRKGVDTDNRHQIRLDQLEQKGKQVELQGELGAARIAAAQAKESGVPSKEERLRYTSLFSEAGRRMGEAQKALGTLQKDIVFMTQANKPGSPQAQELADLRASLNGYKEERDLYGGMLASSQSKAGPSLGSAKTTVAPAALPKDKGALRAGAVYQTSRGPAKWNGTAFEAQ